MSTSRAVILIVVLALVSAGIVALLSRTPASLRDSEAGPTDPSLGAEFSEQQVARGDAFRKPGYASFVVGALLQLAVLLLLARGPGGRVIDALERVPGGWPVRAALAGAVLAVVLALASLPLAFVRGYVVQHDWGLSTQDVGGWLSDQARSLLVAAVTLAIAATAFFGVVRWRPDSWWLWGWGAFTLLTVVLAYLYPVVIAPLFFNFTPLQDEKLTREIKGLAAGAGIEVDRVLVADASRRTTSENAYVAGFGATRQVVVYDTLLDSGGDAETRFVVAHELGHQRANHVIKNIALASLALLGSFALLGWLGRGASPWLWAGAEGIGDLRALPLLAAFALVVGFVLLPVENLLSRAFEREADAAALELTDDAGTAIRTFRRLAFANIADLDPPPLAVWLLYTHPPIPERIEFFLERNQDSA
ncbi:MAG: M48 family metallopeptidase [Actinomycetota bacterium]